MAANAVAQLRIVFPDGSEQTAPVSQSPFNIGRAPGNDLQLAHQAVSRNHARLLVMGTEIVLIDLNSANGTWVGEKKLGANEPCRLAYGDRFTIGPYSLHLGAVPAAPSELAGEPLVEAVGEGGEAGPVLEQAEGSGPPRAVSVPPPGPPAPPVGDLPSYDEAFGLPANNSRYLAYLPPIYQGHPFLGRFLLAFEGVVAPIEQTVDHFDLYLDPSTAPAFFLEQLAAWLGLTLDEKWPLEKRRAVMAEAAELYRRRGTRWGLARHLEIYTGLVPQIVEPEDRPFHFRVLLRVPAGQSVDRATVERIVEANKPAHTTYALEIVQER